jgi:hypothetical protein
MTISTIADYKTALRERPYYFKSSARTYGQIVWCTMWDGSGSPAAGTLSAGNTANGVVPTDATTGAFPIIFGAGEGYLTEVGLDPSPAALQGRVLIYDRLFHAGAYAFNAATTLASQPSYSGRVPGGVYDGTQIWIECVTSMTGALSVAVTYTNQAGTTARTTGTVSVGALTIGQMVQLPLQAGDTGTSTIESVTGTVASVGTFNVLVIRPLYIARQNTISENNVDSGIKPLRHWMQRTGMIRVFGDSCIATAMNRGGTNTGLGASTVDVAMELEISSK